MRTIVAVCLLVAAALAAEETTPRKSRQIITPFATSPLVPFAHTVVPQAHVVAPALHYAQPLVQTVGLAHPAQVVSPVSVVQHAQQIPVHPAAFAVHQPALQRAYGYVQAALQSVSAPTRFYAQPNVGQQNFVLSNGQYVQNIGQSQLNTLNQPSSALYPRVLNTQSQSDRSGQQNQEQNSGSHGYNQQTSIDASRNQAADNSQYLSQSSQQSASSRSDGQYNNQYQQQQSASPQSDGQYNSQYQQQQSATLQSDGQYNRQYQQQQSTSPRSDGQYNSQYQPQDSLTSAQLSPRVSPQQTLAIFADSQYSGISSPNSANQQGNQQAGQVVSQPGENRNDGSYSYGFQSDNGVQSSQVTLVRNYGPSRLQIQGSYPYASPSQYYRQSAGRQQTSQNGQLSSAQSN